jgi:hypothetical protein
MVYGFVFYPSNNGNSTLKMALIPIPGLSVVKVPL